MYRLVTVGLAGSSKSSPRPFPARPSLGLACGLIAAVPASSRPLFGEFIPAPDPGLDVELRNVLLRGVRPHHARTTVRSPMADHRPARGVRWPARFSRRAAPCFRSIPRRCFSNSWPVSGSLVPGSKRAGRPPHSDGLSWRRASSPLSPWNCRAPRPRDPCESFFRGVPAFLVVCGAITFDRHGRLPDLRVSGGRARGDLSFDNCRISSS